MSLPSNHSVNNAAGSLGKDGIGSSSKWHEIVERRNEVKICFQLNDGRHWSPEVIRLMPLDGARMAGRVVSLEGAAPLWMYANAAAIAVRSGAREIRAYQPQMKHSVQVYPIEPGRVQDEWWRCREDAASGTIVEFLKPPVGIKWPAEVLASLVDAAAGWHDELVTLTGAGANWMYAAAAAIAALKQDRHIAFFGPTLSEAILVGGMSDGPILIPPAPSLLNAGGSHGDVIGIVGDPNSGKSVFSRLFYQAFTVAELGSVWRMECDFAAPTPDWYLQLVCAQRANDAKKLREIQKRDWTPEAEQMLAGQLHDCSRSLRWVIADFPGGLHKTKPVLRIPPGREVLIGAANHIIIITQCGHTEIEPSWRQALANHGLDGRVLAVVESREPDSPLSFEVDPNDETRAVATGLHRSQLNSPQLSLVIDRLADFARSLARKMSSQIRSSHS